MLRNFLLPFTLILKNRYILFNVFIVVYDIILLKNEY